MIHAHKTNFFVPAVCMLVNQDQSKLTGMCPQPAVCMLPHSNASIWTSVQCIRRRHRSQHPRFPVSDTAHFSVPSLYEVINQLTLLGAVRQTVTHSNALETLHL